MRTNSNEHSMYIRFIWLHLLTHPFSKQNGQALGATIWHKSNQPVCKLYKALGIVFTALHFLCNVDVGVDPLS